jgi:ABC-type polysaccharide transport system permease subunit
MVGMDTRLFTHVPCRASSRSRPSWTAARVDGASTWQRLRYITVPGMRPTMALLSVPAAVRDLLDAQQLKTTVVGHAVRALYLLAGVVDVYLETGEQALLDSALRQWESLVTTKLYLTGAVGSRFEGESSARSTSCRPTSSTARPAPPSPA